jgi:hypothetical protein
MIIMIPPMTFTINHLLFELRHSARCSALLTPSKAPRGERMLTWRASMSRYAIELITLQVGIFQ